MEKYFLEPYKNRISLLISNKENEIWKIIHNITNENNSHNSVVMSYINELIISYIYVSKLIGEILPYNNVEDFFSYYNLENICEYNNFSKNRLQKNQKVSYDEMFVFLLRHTEGEICRFIFEVLNDNDEDPHFSAVYTSNMIKCFIEVSNIFGHSLLYSDAWSFFVAHGFDWKQYSDFENKYKTESVIYRGTQY